MIDRLRIGQDVVLRFPAFDSATTPDLQGRLSHVSADATTDPQTGASYFTVRASLGRDQIARLGGKQLVPGMPVEAYIQTGVRTPLAYLMKPIEDQLVRSFRH